MPIPPAMRRRPMVGLALVWCAGTAVGLAGGLPGGACDTIHWRPAVAILTGLAVALLSVGAVWRARRASAAGAPPANTSIPILLWLLVLGAAWLNSALWTEHSLARAFPPGTEPHRLTFHLTVTDDPVVRRLATNRIARMFPASVRGMGEREQAARRACGDLLVRWYASPWSEPVPRAGQQWIMHGRLETYAKPGRRPRHILHVNRDDSRPIAKPIPRWWLGLRLTRRTAAELLGLGIEGHPQAVAILRAIMLGTRSEISPELYEAFAATGTVHIFAISGMNVGMIAGLFVFGLRAARISREFWALALAPLLAGYTIMTGASASAMRAGVMAIVYLTAPLLRRQTDGLSSLGLAAVLILAVAPNQWCDVGFQLSFMAMLGLILATEPIDRLLRRLWAPDPWRIQAESRPVRLARALGRQLASLLSLSAAAWLATAPLTALYFGRFTPVALLANLWTVPLSFLIVLTGCLSLLGGLLADGLAVIFNHANLTLITGLTGSMRLAARLPGGSFAFPVEAVPGWAAAAVYLPIALLVWRLRRHAFAAGADDLDDALVERVPPR